VPHQVVFVPVLPPVSGSSCGYPSSQNRVSVTPVSLYSLSLFLKNFLPEAGAKD
jgi:hypothetical protein